MDHSEFRIGVEFISGNGQWRCTDVGTRVVITIRVDSAEQGWVDTATGERVVRTLSRSEAEAIGWFDGPPYGVFERVFDEDDLAVCEPA